jgi:hypothetical protein
MDWDDYESFGPGLGRPLHTVSRAEARAFFRAIMEEKEARKAELAKLCRSNGVPLDYSDESIEALEALFRDNVKADPENPSRPASRWFMVSRDVGLYLGDLLISRAPWLEWQMFTGGKRNISYQRPVIMGFRKVQDSRYNIDPERRVVGYAHRLVTTAPNEVGYFRKFMDAALRVA